MFRQGTKREKAHLDSIWSVAWTKGTNRIITGSVDESVKVPTECYCLDELDDYMCVSVFHLLDIIPFDCVCR